MGEIEINSSVTGCPECGSSLANGLADGLCPACLLRGLDAPDGSLSEAASAAAESALSSLLPIPGYRIIAELARGGMGIVYQARQQAPDREVAVKMLLPFSASSDELRERFRQEARTLTELDHPAILPIYETGEHDRLPWFSMKLATGGSLADRGPKLLGHWNEIAELVATLAAAVQFAHGHGVLHRDLKPGNILFDSAGRPFVADFGLAKLIKQDSDFTHSQRLLGTPHYLAPEVAVGGARAATTASDTYSLGAMLFELLTGRPPFAAESLPALLKQIVEDEPRFAARAGAVDIPGDLKVIALKCLAKEPGHRYGSAREMAEELQRYLAGEPILARAAGPAEKLWRWSRRKPALAAALTACALILAAGVGGVLWQLRQTEAARAEAVQRAKDEHEQRALAETARAQAERSERVMRQNLYAADVLGAQRALDQSDFGTARLLLNAHRPKAGQEDLRGFEWRYFWGKTRGDSFLTLTNLGHEVTALAFSPDGTLLAFGSRQAFLYDATTFQFVARADIPSVQSLAFVPGTNVLVLGTRTRDVHFWNWKSEGPPPFWFRGGRWPNVVVPLKTNAGVMAVGFGDSIAGQTEGSTVLHSSVAFSATGQTWLRLPESGGLAAFSPDAERLATGSWQGQIKLWNPADGSWVKTLTNAHRVVSLRFSPDGHTLVVCSSEGVWLYDLATDRQRPVARGHAERVFDAEISPDGRTLATGSGDQTIRLWDLETGQQKAVFLGHSYAVAHVRWSRDGRMIASGGQDGTVRLWKVEEAESPEMPIPGRVERRFFSPDGRMLAVVHPDEGVTLRKFPDLEVISGPHKAGVALGFLPDGEAFATFRQGTNEHAEILRWSVPRFQLLSRLALDSGTNILRVPSLSRDGRWFAAGLGRSEVGLWNLSGEPKLTRLFAAEAQAALVMALAFAPDSRGLAGTFMDSTLVHLWQVQDGTRIELGRHAAFIRQLLYSSDGRQLISGDGDKFIKVWDLAERKETATLLGHRAGIIGLDLSPDGRTVVSSSGDRTVRLWNLATRREVARFEMESQAQSVTFAPDGSALYLTRRENGQSSPATLVWRAPKLD